MRKLNAEAKLTTQVVQNKNVWPADVESTLVFLFESLFLAHPEENVHALPLS